MKPRSIVWIVLAMSVLVGGGAFWAFSRGKAPTPASNKSGILYYYCPMHPQIHSDKPGQCPICSMTLVPRYQSGPSVSDGSAEKGLRKVKYWVDSMNPSFHSNKPGKAPDGMDLVPVYEDEGDVSPKDAPEALKGLAPIHLSPFQEQLIGLQLTDVKKRPVMRLIRTVGRFGGGAGDFSAAVGDFASGKNLRRGPRYVVADVYALDLPLVKVGQRAWVIPFGGSERAEGQVAQIYPFDGTQSRITRVRIRLLAPLPAEPFANVEIEAVTDPRVSVDPESVLDTGTKQYAFLMDGAGRYRPVTVTVGFKGDDLWEITSGLKEGDRVVDGAEFMMDADSKLQAVFEAMDTETPVSN